MVKVCVPASSANLGPGFDSVGMALSLYNYIEAEETEGALLYLEIQGEGEQTLSRNADNLIVRVMTDLFARAGHVSSGLHLRLANNIPIGKGLGSSAAAVAGALVAANHLAGDPFSLEELLEIGADWEGHPDNVAAALVGGGVVAVRRKNGITYRRFDLPPRLQLVVAVPDFALPTAESRRVLPEFVPLRDAVSNIGCTGLLLLALLQDDLELLAVATEDRLHRPYRQALIPGLPDAFRAAREAGALGVTLSGAGPAVIGFATAGAVGIGEAMRRAFRAHGVKCSICLMAPSPQGTRIVTGNISGRKHRGQ